MGSSFCPFSFMHFIFLALIYSALLGSLCSTIPLCHNEERNALVHFNQSILVAEFASSSPFSYSKVKVASWVEEDCCLWDGIECDKETGHVTGLDLSSSFLYGSINASSGLFRLAHLQRLNLADNHFNFSPIPSEVGGFTELTLLNFSHSVFYGHIPPEITKLSSMTTLDLGRNWLQLQRADFVGLIQNMSSLKKLDLGNVSISSTLPSILGNLTSLTFLNLFTCNLSGEVPSSISNLVKLALLDVGMNNLMGSLPPSLGKLSQLQILRLSHNNFSGKFPFWVANLTQLNYLDFSGNYFAHGDLSWLGKQSRLTVLGLANMNLGGEIPSSVCNMTHLQKIYLSTNQLTGHIPSCLPNLTQLILLDLLSNQLHGPIPNSIFELASIELLFLGSNQLTGIVSFDSFSGLQHLAFLQLSDNGLSFLEKDDNATLFTNLYHLECNKCNLWEFPNFLKYVDKLDFLSLEQNNIGGHIPVWMGNKSRETLTYLSLGYNFFTGFEQASMFSFFTNLLLLSLSFNKIQGPHPILPPSIQLFSATVNFLTGELPPSFCNLDSLIYLHVAFNNLSGPIPSCLGNFGDSLVALSFAHNVFHGDIPETFANIRSLRSMDLSSNQLNGPLPRTLVDCQMLEFIDLSNNHISGEFPSWLGNLPNLEVLLLRSNHLSGEINIATLHVFPKLRILDLSHNNLTGVLPNEFFSCLSNMKSISPDQLEYMFVGNIENSRTYTLNITDHFGFVLANKGTYITYLKIPNIIAAIDLSGNRFYGDVPMSLGSLKMVNVLNISNNHLSGAIPDVLANLSRLESLDLSGNMLFGEIPQRLSQLTSLEYFNVSQNQLVGPIPQGNQFNTFENTSYEGNPGLCGKPLTKMCGNPDGSLPPPPQQADQNDDGSSLSMDWEVVLIGYGCGLVVGLVGGYWIATAKLEWFMKTFRIRQGQPRRTSRLRRGRRII